MTLWDQSGEGKQKGIGGGEAARCEWGNDCVRDEGQAAAVPKKHQGGGRLQVHAGLFQQSNRGGSECFQEETKC